MGTTCRRVWWRLAVAVITVGLGAAPPAEAREGATVAGVRVERYLSAMVTIRPDSGGYAVEQARGFERRSDSNDRMLSDTPVTSHKGAEPLPPLGEFGCTPYGDNPGPTDHTAAGPVRVDVDLFGGDSRAAFHLYSLRNARRAGHRPTTQILLCAAGGARPSDGWRLLQAGIGATYDSGDSHKLGMDWPRGEAGAETGKGFRFGSDAEVGAVGRIIQRPGGKLEGSFIGPFDSDFDDTFNNAVASWWQTPCLDDAPVCAPADGSDAFQGSIGGALWEFFTDEIPADGLRFRVATFTTLACPTHADCTSPAG